MPSTAQEVTKKDIYKVGFRWIMSNTSAWNWERMQNVAFAWSIVPVLKKVTNGDKGEMGHALTRHMAFFNTEPTIGLPLIGAVCAMEVSKAQGEDIPDDVFNAIKSGLMGPMAALGDSLFASTGNALLLSFGMGLALEGNILGPIIFLVGWTAITLGFGLWGVQFGFREGMKIMDSEIFSPAMIEKVTGFLSILGLTVVGGLSAQFVSLSTPIKWGSGGAVTKLQDIVDGLMPGLLPFILVMVVWYLHDKKNVSVIKLLLILIVLGAAGSLLHVF
ncbi:PTS system mannose/fructose/sorbose family transporter subunit IID [Enterococcus hulanensis]|uniref:PTS system mannose/fructose/sorbose family transporter subunit IID n=1 Tax=Enterococcus hulanensis TaxID=2559929 RepID=A0ABU3EUU5_9ENTE|nr:PTS system mannose/fructose/sorbose family transporter subunit IID [Enterococcus hulanensis]MDT2598645.1 PTS system mannose/fructose/sorbose family transporter subunit IID [Enterococcus hulanensis]MDT2607850.1 PTS system mannose/fructose/sorbose family transporter subunit IID [Enterococcus hulanensis]MDT2615145.1 PTS system mannose/fructose/sorbose family transporter subunit IID [Enterococcus hulanensis]MDT2626884.1 PTS system mannose/fructose/sorbose family transporter subunit IID [Enteroco